MAEVAKQIETPRAIIRGRIALAIVYLIRFTDAALSVKDAAVKYGTTVGKVDDIKKNRNFAYVTEDVRFTEAQIEEGRAYIAQHEDADVGATVLEMLNALDVATEEQAAAFAAVKKKAGAQPRTDENGNVIEAGGGNRQGKAKKSKKAKDEAADSDAVEGSDAEAVQAEPADDAAPSDEDLLADI